MKASLTREEWLQHAVNVIRRDLIKVTIPAVQVSCSWPGGGSAQKRIGECWPKAASKAGINEIFISPRLEDSDKVLAVLAHELAHAVDDCQHKHHAPFVAIGRAMGLQGKPTQMLAPEALTSWWLAMMPGPYPHQTLDKSQSPVKKQTTRMIKCECPECSAVWRMSQKHIDTCEHGMFCPVCGGTDAKAA